MYRKNQYTGADLPAKHLCLTYDDGPGKNTYEIARFLHDQNIQATFFVVGKYAIHHQEILQAVATMGHLIGNHTYEHPDMPFLLSVNGDVNSQILRTDAVIKKHVCTKNIYFRSPYGKWSQEVADALNLNILSTTNHLGPIHWDIGGIDCFFWKNGNSVQETVNRYLKDINEKDHGIVVMHDEIADMNYLKDKNNTLALTKQLIPLLKLQGYRFVRLDEIESIRKDVSLLFKFRLKATNGKFVALSSTNKNIVCADAKQNSELNEISIEESGHGKIALKAANNLFFSLQPGMDCIVSATSKEVGEYETFDLVLLTANKIALRAYNGNYLNIESKHGERLVATAAYMRGCERFNFYPVDTEVKNKVSLSARLQNLKQQALYIKSKIQQRS